MRRCKSPPTKPRPRSGIEQGAILGIAMAEASRCRCLRLGHRDAEAEKISKSYVSRILRLALLAPDLVEAILGGWADQRVMLEKLERPLPAGWEEQVHQIGRSVG